MKQIVLRFFILIGAIIAFASYTCGQNLNDSDNPIINYYDAETVNDSPGVIYPIQLCPIMDEITIYKKEEVQPENLELIVKTYIPDAEFFWRTGYIPDYCSIISESDITDEVIDSLRKKDEVSFVGRKYTRQIYKDLYAIYPVKEIATYGFLGYLTVIYLDGETMEAANQLIETKGLDLFSQNYNQGFVNVPKDMDVFAIANELYESGLFYMVVPSHLIEKKTLSAQLIDKSTLPYYYSSDGSKSYWYEVPDRFLIRKNPSTSKSSLETIINEQVKESEIIWENDSICTVITYSDQVDAAMEALSDRDEVLRISHKYFSVGEYEFILGRGLKAPQSFGLTGVIAISCYHHEITETEKNEIISNYNLKPVGGIEEFKYWKYEIPKTSDVLDVCKSIFETGLVDDCTPATTAVYKVVYCGPSGTKVVEVTPDAKEIATQYYNLAGQRINTPSGLTIVVNRYSDGSVRIEKRLF